MANEDACAKALLRSAISEGNFEKVKAVLEDNNLPIHGLLDDDDDDHLGAFNEPTALTLAIDNGQIDLVRNLLEFGEECYTVGYKILEYKGIPDSIVPSDYFGAMVHAAMIDRIDIIQLLAEFRIFKDVRTNHSYKEIVSAAKENYHGFLKKFFEEIEDKVFSLKGWKGHNLMNMLILHLCPIDCIQLMIDNGISVNGWDLNGLTPLRCAVLSKNVQTVQFLLEQGADVYAPQLHGDTHFKDNGTCVDDVGSELSQRNSMWSSCLHQTGPSTVMYAASVRNIPILQLMLESAPLHLGFHGTGGIFGDAPLNYAIHYGSLESINLMLKYKTVRGSIGSGASVSLTVSLNNMELFELMLQNVIKWDPFDVYMCGSHCVFKNGPQYLTRLLKSFRKKFLKGDKGGSLYCAIEAGSFECAHILFTLPGFNVNTRYKYFVIARHSRLTALMYSCLHGNTDFVQLFLNMGAKVDIRDEIGMTAIMHAAYGSHVECFKLLLEAQADLEKTTKGGLTVFSYAVHGNGNCLELLIKSGKLLDKKTKKLKAIHTKGFLIFCQKPYWPSNVKNIKFKLLMQYNLFEWDWCSSLPKPLHYDIAFAAVTQGVSPGKFTLSSEKLPTSLLLFAYHQNYGDIVRYLLANLYFLPEDYSHLCYELSNNSRLCSEEDTREEECLFKMLSQPLSLYQWSFLSISSTFAKRDWNKRVCYVDLLPLPIKLRDELKFKRKYSQLCSRHWKNLGTQVCNDKAYIDDIVVSGKILNDVVLKNCDLKCRDCGGFGLTFETEK